MSIHSTMNEGFSDVQRAGFDTRAIDQDRTLVAIHQVEGALGSAAPGREAQWRQVVLEGLDALEEATSAEADNARAPDSLLSDIRRTQPRLRTRIRGLRSQYDQLRDAISSLRQELSEADLHQLNFAEVRQQLGWILLALRHQRARESDLIYQAYFDVFNVELEAEGQVESQR